MADNQDWKQPDPEPCRIEDVKATRETAKALLVEIENIGEKWVPKSCIHEDSEVSDAKDNASGTLVLKGWWAAKQDWT